jgi:uncharacterized membrane protein YciS (DUF1049 family)
MPSLFALTVSPTYLMYYLPLLLAISIVYGATRHEDMTLIWRNALHTAYWVSAFMGVIFLVLLVIGWMV